MYEPPECIERHCAGGWQRVVMYCGAGREAVGLWCYCRYHRCGIGQVRAA